MASRDDRRAVKELCPLAQKVMQIFEVWEKADFFALPQLCATLNAACSQGDGMLTLMAFSCLGSYKGKQELRADLFETYFMRSRKFQKMQELLAGIKEVVDARVLVILPDQEPRRTWGWNRNSADLRFECEYMVEEARDAGLIPDHWDIAAWSALEEAIAGRSTITHEQALRWAQEPGQALIVHQEDMLLQRYPNILFAQGTRDAAVRQVAGYALEGHVLEVVHPNAVFVQTEASPERKDRMYQPLRHAPMPIIHPFDSD